MTQPNFDEEDKACVLSYNSRGFNEIKIDFMNFLLKKDLVGVRTPILCNQENFILRENAFKLRNAFPDHQLIINPALKTILRRKTQQWHVHCIPS